MILLTIVESPLFQSLWPDYWTEDERGAFSAWLAHTPEAGDVVPDLVVSARFAGRALALVSVLKQIKKEFDDAHD